MEFDEAELDAQDELSDDEDDGAEPEPYLLRLVPESELRASGCATPTGIHLAFFGPACAGLDAWTLGELWGYSPPELEAMRRAGDHLVAVLQSPGARWGRASAETLAGLVAGLRPEAVGFESPDKLVRALTMTATEAEIQGLRKLQRQLASVLGLRDGVFGTNRIARRDEDAAEVGFCLDEKLADPDENGLLPGSALRVEDYPELAVVRRLPWEDEA